MSNAIKFTPAGNRISLAFRSVPMRRGRRQSDEEMVPGLMVTGRDAGPGIPEDELESIFEKCIQSSSTKSGGGEQDWTWPFVKKLSNCMEAKSGSSPSSMRDLPFSLPYQANLAMSIDKEHSKRV